MTFIPKKKGDFHTNPSFQERVKRLEEEEKRERQKLGAQNDAGLGPDPKPVRSGFVDKLKGV